jgi:DNA-binding FadR family transcriptional regulator
LPIQPIESRRLYRQIADQIASLIDRGDYRHGTRLPPERNLASQLSVSRPSVREAVIALEVEGYVEVRMGSGVYVIDPRYRSIKPENDLDQETGPFELIVARRLVEAECAARAARSATPEQIATIRMSLDAMTAGAHAPLTHDQAFHVAIAQASNNSGLLLLVETMWAERSRPLFARLEHHFGSPVIWLDVRREHHAVLDAITARNPVAARKAMRRHIDQAARRFGRNWQGSDHSTETNP